MKRILIITCLILLFYPGFPQEMKKSRKDIRAERESKRIEKINTLLDSRNYVFNATHALPMGGTSIYLTSSYDLTIIGDSVEAFLPFFGVAYQAEYGGRDGGIKFSEPIREYTVEPTKAGKMIKIEVKAPKDIYRMTLSASRLGYATLQVTCNNRQPIQFYGTIEEK